MSQGQMSQSPGSSSQNIISRRDFLLNSPQYSFSPRKRARSQDVEEKDGSEEDEDEIEEETIVIDPAVSEEQQKRERERLLREIEIETNALRNTQRRVDKVQNRMDRERRLEERLIPQSNLATNNSGLLPTIYTTGVGEMEEEELEALESILREMDDNTLTAILTNDHPTDSMEKLIPLLPKGMSSTVLAPARSAGIEGTGSGLHVDREGEKLAETVSEDSFDRLVEDTLRHRLRRSEELAAALKTFTGLSLETIQSSIPTIQGEKGSDVVRHLTIRGTLSGDLGSIILDIDVRESSKDILPQIITLDVDVNDSIYYAIGAEKIKSFVELNNLPAVLLGIQTLIPIAISRFKLFCSICKIYPTLTSEQVRKFEENGISIQLSSSMKGSQRDIISRLPPLSLLINPKYMETFTLQNQKGTRLDIIFRIEFNRYGHAKPFLTIQPNIPQQFIPNEEVQKFIDEIPSKFVHLCAHKPSQLDTRAALVAVIDAFFLQP